MKTRKLMTMMVAMMLLSMIHVSAQSQKGPKERGEQSHPLMFLNLSDEQQAQAKAFYSQMKEKTTPIQLDVKEKEIQLQKLMIADKIDESAVFAKVDEVSALKAQIQKARLQNKIQLRSILNKEQRILFDAKATDKKKAKKQFKDQPKRHMR